MSSVIAFKTGDRSHRSVGRAAAHVSRSSDILDKMSYSVQREDNVADAHGLSPRVLCFMSVLLFSYK